MDLIIKTASQCVMNKLGTNFLILEKVDYPSDISASQIHACLNAGGFTVKTTGTPNGVSMNSVEMVICLSAVPNATTKTNIIARLLDTTLVRTYT